METAELPLLEIYCVLYKPAQLISLYSLFFQALDHNYKMPPRLRPKLISPNYKDRPLQFLFPAFDTMGENYLKHPARAKYTDLPKEIYRSRLFGQDFRKPPIHLFHRQLLR